MQKTARVLLELQAENIYLSMNCEAGAGSDDDDVPRKKKV